MPSGALHRLVYMSTAVGVLRADELDRIYLRAKSANSRAGITGLLLFYEGAFLQALEGPAAGVMSLAERLRRDRRHSGMITLESQSIDDRAFPEAMQFVAARNLSAGEKQAFSDLRQAVSARSHMIGAPAPGADNGLWDLISAFNPLRAV
ncbi:MAG: BLUF domain-containing protein [Burkholderiales bacterium]|nr:MAG: BLUF domain-containing protein [Burkholderiales bacterium]